MSPPDATSPDPAAPGGAAPPQERLGVALEAALMRALLAEFTTENWARFGERLTPPRLTLTDDAGVLGRWRRATRTLELSRALVLGQPWPVVVSVLQHEMAHQFVDEVLRVDGETAHGETFRRVCREAGIDGAASGMPAPAAGAHAADERVLEKIRKLLALAGSANQHEAEVAMQRAHALMLRHNLDEVAAAEASGFEVRHVGDPHKRTSAVETAVLSLLSEFFFVRVIRVPVYLPREGKRGGVHELTGTRANLELALHVHAFLLATAERLWRDNRTDRRVRSGRDRLAYQTGVIAGFRARLEAERKTLAGTGLVWKGDARLDEHYHRRHPRITTRHSHVRAGAAHAAGREAGGKVVLHRPVADGPGGTRRLLTGG